MNDENSIIRRSDVFKLNSGVIVTIIDTPSSYDKYHCMILKGADNPAYQQYGYDIYVFFSELKTAEKITKFEA